MRLIIKEKKILTNRERIINQEQIIKGVAHIRRCARVRARPPSREDANPPLTIPDSDRQKLSCHSTYIYSDCKACGDRFWAKSVTNYLLQKSNKLHNGNKYTECIISDIVSKLLSEIWQSLLNMLYQQIGDKNRAEFTWSIKFLLSIC